MARLHAQIDCSLPDDPKVIDVGPMAELVYVRCILRGREHLTDGVIDRRRVSRWFIGVPNPTKQLGKLVDAGLLDLHPDGWCIPLDKWTDWNPTKAEVEAKRDAAATRKRQWRNGGTDSGVTASVPWDKSVRDIQPEPEPEPEPEPSSSRVQVGETTTTTLDQRVADAIDWHARTSSEGKDKPGAYAATVRNNTMIEHGAAMREYAGWHPADSAAEIVHHVLIAPNAQSERTVREAWYADPHCQTCDGDGFRNHAPEGHPSMLGPCDCRRPEPYLATVHEIRAATA